MIFDSDIDIDVSNREEIISSLKCVPAMIKGKNGIEKHNTGVYFQDIPCDIIDYISTIDYKEAEKLGYFKIDFLNVHFYEDIRDEQHLINLMDRPPDWDMLLSKPIVEKLFHLNNHYDLCKQMAPKSIEQLAMLLALIRPAKKHLIGKPWDEIKDTIWKKPTDNSYYFKKSHSISYAMAIVVQMNLIEEQNIKDAI